MATRFESLLRKVDGWGRWPAERNGGVQWPKNVLAYLEKEFHLLPKDMAALRCVGHRGSLGGLSAIFVRVFAPEMAYEQGIIVNGYRDLDNHPELVLFQGHVFDDGTVRLRKKKVHSSSITS